VGTFLLFVHPIIILFDFGATHDFTSSVCAQKAKLALMIAKAPYMISTPGGQVVANQIAREVTLELARQVYCTHLIILDGQGVDVILGMSWLNDRGRPDLLSELVVICGR
jgi:predicted aspartyl protease